MEYTKSLALSKVTLHVRVFSVVLKWLAGAPIWKANHDFSNYCIVYKNHPSI